jgi:hypothetical protein
MEGSYNIEQFIDNLFFFGRTVLVLSVHLNHSLHFVHGMNSYRAEHVYICRSVRIIHLENRWMILDEVLVWTLELWRLAQTRTS